MIIDTHVHLNADQYNEDLQQVIERARNHGVEKMMVVGFDEKTINRCLEIIDENDDVYGIIGWHPVDAVDCTDDDLNWIEQLIKDNEKIVAVGEMGLDYHWDKSPKDIQKEVFRKQIALAKRVNKPIVIHNREATEDVMKILKEEDAHEVGGIMHSFIASPEIMKDVIEMNFYISLGGPVTFKNAKQPKEVAKAVPLDRLLIETDAPYLTPHPHRGKRNEPAYVKLVAEQIADLREMSYEDLAKATTENALRFFRLNENE